MAMKGYSAFTKAPALLEPYHQIVFVSYPGHSLLLLEGVLPFSREAVNVFYSPNQMKSFAWEFDFSFFCLMDYQPSLNVSQIIRLLIDVNFLKHPKIYEDHSKSSKPHPERKG